MKTTTANRLNKIMNARNLRQVDILELAKPHCIEHNVKLGRNDLSQYVSGKVSPGQDKLTILALALGVSETWLMGYNVPMKRDSYEDPNIVRFDVELDEALRILVNAGYEVLVSEHPTPGIITIKDTAGKTLSSMYDYEMVGRYESLQKDNKVSAERLLKDPKQIFLSYLDSLGYHLIQDDSEQKPFMRTDYYICQLKYDTLNKLQSSVEKYARAAIDSELLALHEEEIKQERIEKEEIIQLLSKETPVKEEDRTKTAGIEKALEEQSCTKIERFADKLDALQYLKSRNNLAAFKNDKDKLTDDDIINIANLIYNQEND